MFYFTDIDSCLLDLHVEEISVLKLKHCLMWIDVIIIHY